MQKEVITEEDILDAIEKYINNHKEDERYTKGVHLLRNLLKEIDHWLASYIDTVKHCYSLKSITDHIVFTFMLLVRSIIIFAKCFLDKSTREPQISIHPEILSVDDQIKTSSLALEKLTKEYQEVDFVNNDTKYSPNCCITNGDYGIPCRHLIKNGNQKVAPFFKTTLDFSRKWLISM